MKGLIRACDIIDLIIEILRGSSNLKMAKECLMTGNAEGIKFKSEASKKQASQLDFTERQASAILEMRLYKLIGLEILALQKEYDEACKKIARYEKILGSRKEMAKVIKEDLMKIKKEYAVDRRTVIEDGKEAVFIEKKVPEQEVMFIMDHQIKVKDIPFSTKFRDKGTPIDNLGNYDSSGERIIYLCASERIRQKRLLFVTKLGMMKLVDTSEFDVMKKTVASTKLTDGDELIGIYETDARTEVLSKFNYDGTVGEEEVVSSDQNIILQTANGVFLKFPLTDVPQKKKNAVGVRGIKLGSDDYIEDVYILTNGDELSMDYKGKMLDFGKMKMAHRDTKGTKVRR